MKAKRVRKRSALFPSDLDGLPSRKAGFIEPMKAVLVDELPKGPDWIYEVKFDGVRAVAVKRNREVQLISRAAKDLTGKYSKIAEALRDLPAKEAVLDGEVVALDAQGRPSFQLLQSAQMPGMSRPPLFYYVFDLLQLDGTDLTRLLLVQRKELAAELVKGMPSSIRFSPGIKANSERVFRELKARGLEGLIAKKRDSIYEPGRRSGAWVKYKWTKEQEFVIGGYTKPRGARLYFGAILVGYYEGKQLRFAGKVGTGFSQKQLRFLYEKFHKLRQPDCPFANLPESLPSSRSGGLTAREMRLCTWLEPKLVCEVRFSEWTRDNHLRQPSFLGLREDKRPGEVVREKPKAISGA